jgi:hypothetical protein
MPRAPKNPAAAKKPKPGDVDTLLYADGTTTEARPNDGVSYHLKELYSMLGCSMVEVVHTQIPGLILICDEEGTFVENPVRNVQASNMAGTAIVGNALVCHTSRFK